LLSVALFGAINLAWSNYTKVDLCPKLGPVPACYVFITIYVLILVGIIRPVRWFFLSGAIAAFALASIGIAREIIYSTPVCPQTSNGIPTCYIFFIVILVLIAFGSVFFGYFGFKGKYKNRQT